MSAERRAPVQGSYGTLKIPDGTIAWDEHLQAFEGYAKRHGREQSAERMAQRGGFGAMELWAFLGHPPQTWRAR